MPLTIKIGEKFIRAPLGHQTLRHIGAAIEHAGNFDFRILFMKFAEKPFEIRAAIKRQLPFFFGGFDAFLPVRFPSVGLRRECASTPKRN